MELLPEAKGVWACPFCGTTIEKDINEGVGCYFRTSCNACGGGVFEFEFLGIVRPTGKEIVASFKDLDAAYVVGRANTLCDEIISAAFARASAEFRFAGTTKGKGEEHVQS